MPLAQNISVASGAARSGVMKGGVRYLTLTVPNPISTGTGAGKIRFDAQAGSTYTPIKTSGGTNVLIGAASGATVVITLNDTLTKALTGMSAFRLVVTEAGGITARAQAGPRTFTLSFTKRSV